MAIIESGSCKIRKLNTQGEGLGESLHGPVVLPYTLPGEEVAFERHAYRRQTNCVLKEVLLPAPDRQTPPCPHFGTCGGCMLQHIKPGAYETLKTQMLRHQLSQHGMKTVFEQPEFIPAGTRRRVNFQFVKKRDQVFLGYYKYRSDKIVDITICPLVMPSLSELILPLKKLLNCLVSNDTRGEVHVLQAVNGMDIVCEIPNDFPFHPIEEDLLKTFAVDHSILNLAFERPGGLQVLINQGEAVVDFSGIQVKVHGNSFLQASYEADRILTDLVCKDVSQGTASVDLFCGRGTYTFALSQLGSVKAFDGEGAAIRAMRHVIGELSINVHHRDLFKNPLEVEELSTFGLAVLNPPRAGAHAQCRYLAVSQVPEIRYVSCNPDTFVRDAQILITGGYTLEKLTPVDQFPWSAHWELVGVFKKT